MFPSLWDLTILNIWNKQVPVHLEKVSAEMHTIDSGRTCQYMWNCLVLLCWNHSSFSGNAWVSVGGRRRLQGHPFHPPSPASSPFFFQPGFFPSLEIFDLDLKFCVSIGAFLRDYILVFKGFPGGAEVKASACNVGDLGSIPGSGRSLGEGNGNPLQYSSLENPMDGGAWWATVHGSQRVGHNWPTSLSLSVDSYFGFPFLSTFLLGADSSSHQGVLPHFNTDRVSSTLT